MEEDLTQELEPFFKWFDIFLEEKYFLKKIDELALRKNFEKAIEYRNKLLLFQKLIYMHVYSNLEIDPSDSKKSLQELTVLIKKYFPCLITSARFTCS